MGCTWATGLVFQNGKLAAEFADSGGRTTVEDLPGLATRGLPTLATHRRKVTADFSTWTSVSGASYLKAFKLPQQDTGRHEFFQFSADSVDFVVPALALMRAFFRPTQYVIPLMLMPQGIEHICVPSENYAHCELSSNGSWSSKRRTKDRASGVLPLSWLYSFPSARGMCGSVHSHALAGHLGMSLPLAKAHAVLHGLKMGKSFYATEVRIMSLDALEPPFDFAENHCRAIPFYSINNKCVGGRRAKPLQDGKIRPNPTGTFAVSDHEWDAIEPLLTTKRNAFRAHDARLQFDGVVEKVGTGVSWRKMNWSTGTWETASSALQRWKKNGVLAKALDVLAQRPAYNERPTEPNF